MESLIEEYLNQRGIQIQFEVDDIEYKSDYSDFISVDGEEGDHGVIKHFKGEMLIAQTFVHGGDMEETEFTPQGEELLNKYAIELINERLGVTKCTNTEIPK